MAPEVPQRLRRLSVKTVVCFGASLTAGTVSFNYLDLLSARPALAGFKFINHGVNGDLAWNGLQRLDAVIADKPDFVSILMGTNDVNYTMSERNAIRYNSFNKLPQQATPEWYAENMKAIVQRLKSETEAKIAFLSLAPIGEDPDHEANRKVNAYNEITRQLASEQSLPYFDLNEIMWAYLREHETDRAGLPPMLEYRDGLHNTGNAVALHHSGLSWDEVSKRNGLLLLTDTLHLNSIAAGMIADLIEGWLVGISER